MPKYPSLYRVEIIPLTPLFGKKDPRFSYLSKELLSIGSLVSIPFGKRIITGVVVDFSLQKTRAPHWMKYVGPVLLPQFLSQPQIALAHILSETTYTPLGMVLRHFFPVSKAPKKKEIPLGAPREKSVEASKKVTLPRLSSLKKALGKGESIILHAAKNEQSLLEEISFIIKLTQKTKKQILLLVPEILAAELFAKHLTALFPGIPLAVLSSARTPREEYILWESIRTGKTSLIIGTRQALFAPYQKLGSVLMLDPENRLSYVQWEMAPRYDSRVIAEKLAELHKATFITLSTAPGLEYFAPTENAPIKKTGEPFQFTHKESLALIDLRKNFKRRSKKDVLTQEFFDELKKVLKEKGKALVLVRQRGLARFSLCDRCHTVFRCPHCSVSLTETKDGSYKCLSCSYHSPLFPSCPSCGHMHFRSFGAGTQTIERALSIPFPHARILTLDRDSLTQKKSLQSLTELLAQEDFDIVIATYEIGKTLPLSELSFIAMIEPDDGLYFPDYQADERLWRDIRRFGGKLSSQGKLVIQTFKPESAPWSLWPWEKPGKTAADFLVSRETLHYPPFFDFLLIDCPSNKKESSQALAARIESALRKIAQDPIEILPSFPSFSKRKSNYRVLVRFPHSFVFPQTVEDFLKTIAHEVRITRNPPSLHHSS